MGIEFETTVAKLEINTLDFAKMKRFMEILIWDKKLLILVFLDDVSKNFYHI